MAATIAPVSSNTLSCSVIAERITASCHSNGMPSERTQSRQYAAVSSKKRRPTSATAPCTLVRAEQQGDGILQIERSLLHQGRNRCVRSEAQHQIRAGVPDMIRAAGGLRGGAAIVPGGAQAHPDTGIAGDPFDLPHQHHGTEHPAILMKAGAKS